MIDLHPLEPAARINRLEQALVDLEASAAALRRRSTDSIVESLGAVLEEWRRPDSPYRQRLESELAETSGFSVASTRAGLDLGLRTWTGEALRSIVESEVGGVERGSALVTGFERTNVILAGSIPMPTFSALLTPLILRSPVAAKCATRDTATPALWAESVANVDAELAAALTIFAYPSDDEGCTSALLGSGCSVVMGSDESIRAISHRTSAFRRFVAYGHRVSLAVLGPEATKGAGLERAAAGIAVDTALWDQQGCLSPLAVHVVDPDSGAAGRVGQAIADALDTAERRYPRGELATAEAAAFREACTDAEMRTAADRCAQLHGGGERPWAVAVENDARRRSAPLGRFLRVHPVMKMGSAPEPDGRESRLGDGRKSRPGEGATASSLETALSEFAPHLSALAVDGFGDDDQVKSLARLAARCGASRICRPGELQAPPLGWHHDGMPLLLPLAKITDLEIR